jgi:hypothetical protein
MRFFYFSITRTGKGLNYFLIIKIERNILTVLYYTTKTDFFCPKIRTLVRILCIKCVVGYKKSLTWQDFFISSDEGWKAFFGALVMLDGGWACICLVRADSTENTTPPDTQKRKKGFLFLAGEDRKRRKPNIINTRIFIRLRLPAGRMPATRARRSPKQHNKTTEAKMIC